MFERKRLGKLFRGAVKRADLYSPDPDHNVSFKTLRHTFASHLAMQGRHPKEIADLMGHSRLEQTMTYMHLSPNRMEDAVCSLDGLTGLSQNVTKLEKSAEDARQY